MAVGKKAERLVKDLLTEAGFEVFPYGYEYTMPKLAKRPIKITGKAAEYIRHQPDFVIVNKRGEAFFVEVKYRSSSKIELEHIFNYPNSYVILLTKELIVAQSTRYIYRYGQAFNYLNNMPPFANIPIPLIRKYVERIKRTFGDETWLSQKTVQFVEEVAKKEFVKKAPKRVTLVRKTPVKRRTVRKTTRRSSPSRGRGRGGKGNVRAQKQRARARKRTRRR